MKNAIIYLRVSTSKQGNKTSLEGQEIEIREFAVGRQIEVVDVYREVSSATGPFGIQRRPELRQAIARSRATGEPILVTAPDRFCRNLAAFDEAMRAGPIDVRSVSAGGHEDLDAFRSGVARAEFDSRKIGEATKRGQRAAKERGKKFGSPCLDRVRPRALAAIQRNKAKRLADDHRVIAQALATGIKPPRELADCLNKAGRRTARGLPYSEANMRRILRNLKAVEAPTAPAPALIESLFGRDHKFNAAGAIRLRAIFADIAGREDFAARFGRLVSSPLNDVQKRKFVEAIERREAVMKCKTHRLPLVNAA